MNERLEILFEKYYKGQATHEEMAELQELLARTDDNGLSDLVTSAWETLEQPDPQLAIPDAEGLKKILGDKHPGELLVPAARTGRIGRIRTWAWAAAAMLAGVMAVGAYYLVNRNGNQTTKVVARVSDVAPGTNKAILTLSDGSSLTLDSAGTQVIRQGATAIQQQGASLKYDAKRGAATVYNKLSTPRGGQFQVVLSDGTKVWLNAASSIRYATVFTETERTVEVNGEAYFEVAPDQNRPFKVVINDHYAIYVLGTSFNIKAYADEPPFKTTLLEGAVKAALTGDNEKSIVIKPGQQVQLRENDRSLQLVKEVNIEQEMAWKYGNFNFEGQTLEEVMKQISRWYDIDVVFENGVPPISFGGGMSRDVNLNAVLDFLRDSRIHFRLEKNGKRLIVTK